MTVLFADMSGYTTVAERMDPELLKGLLDRCLQRLEQEVLRFGGRVDKYIGDSVMAIFGAPVAHEDDAERAVRAALGMQSAVPEINQLHGVQHGVTFALRVGINSGEVLAGRVGDGYTVIGDAVNVASRLQTVAQLGSVTVGAPTYRATRERVEYRPLQPLDLKGKSDPVPAYEALGLRELDGARSEAQQLTPLVGRDNELMLLNSLYDRVQSEGRPHQATVIGQAGVGKSRLLREFALAVERQPTAPQFRRGRCLPYGSSIVYWSLGEVLRAECQIIDGDPSNVAWQKLSRRVGDLLAATTTEDARSKLVKTAMIGRLLGIDVPADQGLIDSGDSELTREMFFAAVRSCVEGMARDRPLILAWEDIHWADQGMLDLIQYLTQSVRGPVLQVCLARDELLERRAAWGEARRSATTVFLDPLGQLQTRELICALLPDAEVADDTIAAITERADGNPLFAEEMVKRLTEEATTSADELPDSVHVLLAARLDALKPSERRLVSHAAVVGRTFWEDALQSTAAAEGVDLHAALLALREKDIIVTGEVGLLTGEPELAFKHVLIRDVAYGMLPKAVRAQKHFEVGAFIEERAGERQDEVVALLAHHYGRAAQLGEELKLDPAELAPYQHKALHHLEAAGDAAAALYSNAEAFAHYEVACASADDGRARARISQKQGDVAMRLGRVDAAIAVWTSALAFHREQAELEAVAELQCKIGAALAHKGERKKAIEQYQMGINLIKDGPPSLALVSLYEEAAWLYIQTGDNMLAIYAAEKALRLAELLSESRAASRAHGIFGRVFGRIGDTVKAREHLERAVELARGSRNHEVLALLALGHHLENAEGKYQAARTTYEEGMAIAQRIGDVPSQIELHAAIAQLAVYTCDWDEVRRSSDASAELSEREGLLGKLCLPYVLRGVLAWRDSSWQLAEDLFRQAHTLAEQLGWSEACFAALYGMAASMRDRGDLGEAEMVLSQALDVCERAGLMAQSTQANSALAVLLVQSGRYVEAREAADEATTLAKRVHYPVCEAAALEAEGAVGELPEAIGSLRAARDSWHALGRPLDRARCELLLGERLLETNVAAATAQLDQAAAAYDTLEIKHLALRARDLSID